MPLIDYAVPIEHPPDPFPTPGYNLINNSTNSYYNSFVISRRRNTGNSLTWPYIYCISLSLYKQQWLKNRNFHFLSKRYLDE